MSVTITWTNTEPTVDEWSEEQTLTRDAGDWRARIKFCIARVSGTRNVAIRAVVGLRGENSLDHNAYGTPGVKMHEDEDWTAGTTKQWTTHNTTWNDAAPQYAIFEGAKSKAQFDCKLYGYGTTLTLDSPLQGPAIFLNVGGEIIEADTVYVNVGGEIIEADSVFMNVNGDIVES